MSSFSEEQSISQDKKYTKVSSALKCKLLKLIYVEKLTIKQSAKNCGLNYSTAKCVLKQITKKQEKYIQNQAQKKQRLQKKHKWIKKNCCIYRNMQKADKKSDDCTIESQVFIDKNIQEKRNSSKILIVSTVGHDFFQIQKNNDIQKISQEIKVEEGVFFRKTSYQSILSIKKPIDEDAWIIKLQKKISNSLTQKQEGL